MTRDQIISILLQRGWYWPRGNSNTMQIQIYDDKNEKMWTHHLHLDVLIGISKKTLLQMIDDFKQR